MFEQRPEMKVQAIQKSKTSREKDREQVLLGFYV